MFQVVFVKAVYESSASNPQERIVVLRRIEEIPFPPSVGMEFSWPMVKPDKLQVVRWDFEERKFTCIMQEEYSGNGVNDFCFDELVEFFVSSGWVVASKSSK